MGGFRFCRLNKTVSRHSPRSLRLGFAPLKNNLKKTKTENLTDDLLKSQDELKIDEIKTIAKNKVNYNIEDKSDESDALSDSEPSEDNFEEE